ncbi:MAG: DUF2061 domain-containing protein [Candidatus Woesebacteria bacterium]|nr:MAG: DUF2061 domain-containing protein [Candidatus Woesebacteria bacterium]
MKKKQKFYEHKGRSVIKALTFRFLILCSDSIIIFAITKRLDLTIGVITLSNVASTLIYFLHERLWNHIHWGKVLQ